MKDQTEGSGRMNETDYSDVISGRNGSFQQEELQKIISDCKAKGIPFLLTDERGEIIEKIIK